MTFCSVLEKKIIYIKIKSTRKGVVYTGFYPNLFVTDNDW